MRSSYGGIRFAMHRFQCHVEQVEQMPRLGFKQILQLMIIRSGLTQIKAYGVAAS
jgi:hypothetical protein